MLPNYDLYDFSFVEDNINYSIYNLLNQWGVHMSATTFENLRTLIIDVDSMYTASNVVVYKDNIDSTVL